jgi:hypothetical protein
VTGNGYPYATSIPDLVDLTNSAGQLPSNTLQSFNGNGALSAFNFFDNTDFNQWYTSVVGLNTVLVSKFVYNIASTSAAATSTSATTTAFTAINWQGAIATTGDKLCYASFSTGNFQTHLRENVPLWFLWIGIIAYWLIYLLSDATNRSIFNK